MFLRKFFLYYTGYVLIIFLILGVSTSILRGPSGFAAAGISVCACWLGEFLAVMSINFSRYYLPNSPACIIIGTVCRLGVAFSTAILTVIVCQGEMRILVLLVLSVTYLLTLPVGVILEVPMTKNVENEKRVKNEKIEKN
ncbi:MAG: hypothetical protein ACRC2T_05935 [Thermoguttaceae bacterium]